MINKSQNLVPNSSFETYTLCPTNSCNIELYAINWTSASANSSTDYLNLCSPSCKSSTQSAMSGNGYAGCFFKQHPFTDLREYLQVQLISPLVQNTTYYVEFYVILRDISSISGCNNIAANLSIARPYTNTLGVLQPLTPHIFNAGNPIINDKINWVQISGCYTAQGGEEYLTIGNFMDDANTQTTGTTATSYYFVDDVRVEEMTSVCVTGLNELNKNHYIKVYPNPNNGSFSITYTFEDATHNFELYDLMGRKVIEKTLNGNEGVENINLNKTDGGVYFYKVSDSFGKMLFTGKLIINK